MRLIRDITEKLHLYLVGGVKTVSGAIVLPHGSENILAHAVEVKVVASVESASAQRASTVGIIVAWPVSPCRTVVPVVLQKPRVPTLMHEITGARGWVGIGGRRIVKWAIRNQFVGRVELAEEAVVVTDLVNEMIVKIAARRLCRCAIIHRAVKRLIVIIHEPVRYQIRRIPMFRVFQVDVAGVVPAAVAPVVPIHVIGSIFPKKILLPAAMRIPEIGVSLAGASLHTEPIGDRREHAERKNLHG